MPARDDIRVDGSRIKLVERHLYLLLNKPRGYVSTRSDPEQRPTVIDLLRGVRDYVYPVGTARLRLRRAAHPDQRRRSRREAHASAPRRGARVRSARARRARRPRSRSPAEGRRHRRPEDRTGRREGARPGPPARHRARRAEPPGAEDVRRDRPSGHEPEPRRDRADSGREAEARSLAGVERRRGAEAAEAADFKVTRARRPRTRTAHSNGAARTNKSPAPSTHKSLHHARTQKLYHGEHAGIVGQSADVLGA